MHVAALRAVALHAVIRTRASAMLICILYGRVIMWLAGCAVYELFDIARLPSIVLRWQ